MPTVQNFEGDLSAAANEMWRDQVDNMTPTAVAIGLGKRIQKLGVDGSFSGTISTDVSGTTNASFEVDSDSAAGSIKTTVVGGGTDNTVTLSNSATTQDVTLTYPDFTGTFLTHTGGQIQNTITDLTNVQHDHSNVAGGGPIVATGLSGTTNGTWEINSTGFSATLDTTELSQDSTFTFNDSAGPDELCGIAATQTLTNKTLTSPTITGMTATGASTLESCVIGGVTPAAASVTTLSASGASTLTGEVQVGGGYGSTGITMTTAGNISANGTISVIGAADFSGITGNDASLGIAGIAGSAGNGGIVAVVGGAGDANNNGGAVTGAGGAGSGTGTGGALTLAAGASGSGATGDGGASSVTGGGAASTDGDGGAASVVGGAGAGTGVGGAISVTGGAGGGGATGNGGALTATGGAAASTNGDGGASSLIGGVATGTGTGGAVTITAGASAGNSGTAGAVGIDTGSAAGGTGAAVTIGAANATEVVLGASDADTRVLGDLEQNATAGAASSVVKKVIRLDSIADNVSTSFLTFTIPNAAHAAAVEILFLAQVEDQTSARVAKGTLVFERNAGADTVGTAVALTGEGIATTAAGETLTFAYALGAAVGAVGATQTMPLNVTLNTSGATEGELIAVVEMINSEATGITVAAS